MGNFDTMCDLPGTPEEAEWLRERLETLSVKEGLLLTAAQMRQPAGTMADAVRELCSFSDYTLIAPAESYEELGRRYLEQETRVPRGLHNHADLNKLGRWYEDTHPGLFIGNCYAAYPQVRPYPLYNGTNLSSIADEDWSVKLKLASPSVPEGIWVRLPDYEEINGEASEVQLALDALGVETIQECTLLETRCILPGITGLQEQYDDLAELIRDSQNLGFALDELTPYFRGKFLAVLEYEGCRCLKEALDISQNLGCYDFAEADDLEKTSVEHLEKAGVPETVIRNGCFDLKEYGAALMTEKGFTIIENGNFVRRNETPFVREFSEVPSGMTMTM